jgi:conjugative transfer signal peptidase TraF
MVERREAGVRDEAQRENWPRARTLTWCGLIAALALACLAAEMIMPPHLRLVWNVSASAPLGLYRVTRQGDVRRGDMVIARVPAVFRQMAADRDYIPANVPLVKRVAGISGDRICAIGRIITINRRSVAVRREADSVGRPLPRWRGCLSLRGGELLLLMARTPNSFDGRYFGASAAADVLGRATLLWRD